MLIFKIKELLEKNNMSRYKLRYYTNFSYERVNDYYFGRVRAMKPEELEILCKVFQCNINDIIEYKE